MNSYSIFGLETVSQFFGVEISWRPLFSWFFASTFIFLSCTLSLKANPPAHSSETTGSAPTTVKDSSPTISLSLYAFPISESELRDLAQALAPKVDLFRAVWEVDPEAEFFAGTTRDYLYWILGHFKNLENLEPQTKQPKITEIKSKLLAIPFIKFNEIVGPESDADIMTKNREALSGLRAEDFAIRKLDFISFDRALPGQPMYQDEINQGFIPSEKIRLSKNGISTDSNFRNGVADLVSGNLSIQFPDRNKFWKTHYAKEGANHPLLLALRYVRILAQDYLQRHGSEIPDPKKLEVPMTNQVKKNIQALIRSAIADTDGSFKKLLGNEQGKKWLNASIQKSFRSFTNANAAFELMKELGILGLIEVYPNKIESVHQYLLKTPRNETEIAENFKKFGIKPKDLYEKIAAYLPDLELYHGTASELAFRNIIYQGIIPSGDGSAGRGLYGVSKKDLEFAKNWSNGKSGQDDLVIALKLESHTKIVDITQGKGKELFEAWIQAQTEEKKKLRNDKKDQKSRSPKISSLMTLTSTSPHTCLSDEDSFAQAFGIDILRYHYQDSNGKKIEAFALKNSEVISTKRGVFKNPRPLSELLSEAENAKQNDDLSILKDFLETPLTKDEKNKIISILGAQYFTKAIQDDRIQTLRKYLDLRIVALFNSLLDSPITSIHSLIWKQVLALLKDTDDYLRWQMTSDLKHQSSWPISVWNEVPTLMKDQNAVLRSQISYALEHQSSWPTVFWNEVPALMKDSNVGVRWKMVEALAKQSSWPISVWNEVPTLMKDKNDVVRLQMISALRHQNSWPIAVWNEVPTLMKDSKDNLRAQMPLALKPQSSWPISVWNEVPTLMKDSNDNVRAHMRFALEKHSTWPPSFWNEIPALLTHPNPYIEFTMVRALLRQSSWPQSIIDLVAQSTYPKFWELKKLNPSILDLSTCKNSISEIQDSKPQNYIPGEATP